MMYTCPFTPHPSLGFQSSELVPDIPFKCHPPLISLYINDREPHYLLCTSIIPPEVELQQQFRKFVTGSPCPDEAFYFEKFHMICAGHQFSPFLNVGRVSGNYFLNHSTVFTEMRLNKCRPFGRLV